MVVGQWIPGCPLGIEYCVERERGQNASWENLIAELKGSLSKTRSRFLQASFAVQNSSFS